MEQNCKTVIQETLDKLEQMYEDNSLDSLLKVILAVKRIDVTNHTKMNKLADTIVGVRKENKIIFKDLVKLFSSQDIFH